MLLSELLIIGFGLAGTGPAPHIFIGHIVPASCRGSAIVIAATAVMALTYVLHVRVIRLVSAVLCGQYLIGMHCRLIR